MVFCVYKFVLIFFSQTELDRIGCKSGCSALLDLRHDQFFVLAKDEVAMKYKFLPRYI